MTQTRHALAPYRLRRALEFIASNIAVDIGLEDIAAAAGLSSFHFGRAFRRDMGVSPYAFLLQERMACARKLLGDSLLPVTEVADRCGFNSSNQFSRCFKRSTGFSPARYRSLH